MALEPATPESRAWWRPGLWEILLAAVAVVLSLRVLASADLAPGFRPADLLGYLVTGLGAAATVWGRRRPLTALVVAGTSATALAWWDYHVDVLPFVVTGLLFMVGSYRERRPAGIGLAVGVVGILITAVSRPPDLGVRGVLQTIGIFVVAWVLGRLTRSRRQALLALVAAAEQQATAERQLAAVERDQALLAQVEERLRIARELHDVLAHSISVISVQATVGEHLAASDPAAAGLALQTIGEVSRSSMQELRQMLTLLRDDSAAAAAPTVSYEPARGLADLEALVQTYRSAGLPVRTETEGIPRVLSPSADLCAYRIVQEALTNTLKHAGPSAAIIRLDYGGDALLVTVSDNGHATSPPSGGHGLVGMRERTALLGGEFRASSGPGGFMVSATIPYESAPHQPDSPAALAASLPVTPGP